MGSATQVIDTVATKKVAVQLEVTVPSDTTNADIEASINAALDEPKCDWGDWTVGGAVALDD